MRRLVWWLQWHRRIGAAVAVLVMLLAITGVLINHSQSLGWYRKPVYSTLLADLYGIPVEAVQSGFRVDRQWILQLGEQLLLDLQPVADCPGHLLGAAKLEDMIAVVCGRQLLLLDAQGALIESSGSVPDQGQRIALQDSRLLLATSAGNFAYDDGVGAWQPVQESGNWIVAETLPANWQAQLASQTPVPGLTWERVLLDLHSGRLFGNVGVWIVDLVGVAICLLAISGVYAWAGRKLRHRK